MNILPFCFFSRNQLMLGSRSFRAIPLALIIWLVLEFYVSGNGCGVEAAISGNEGGKVNNQKSPIGKHHPSHSDFVIKYSDGTPFSAQLEYQYLLPEQTIFDSTDEPVASKVLLTSPPGLTIQPSHVEVHNYRDKSAVNKQFAHQVSNGAPIYVSRSMKPEACVSETPTFPFVASSFPTDLRTGVQYAITAGRVETASSTNSVNDVPVHIASKMSQPSTVLLQGTSVNTRSLAGQSHILFNS